MKKLLLIAAIATFFAGCAVGPLPGVIYTGADYGLDATANAVGSKVGTGQATAILGIVATGDASINTAARQAGISRISHVDYKVTNIIGVYQTYEIYVYGE